MKLLLFADLHLYKTSAPTNGLDVLTRIGQIAKKYNVDKVVCLGDFLDNKKQITTLQLKQITDTINNNFTTELVLLSGNHEVNFTENDFSLLEALGNIPQVLPITSTQLLCDNILCVPFSHNTDQMLRRINTATAAVVFAHLPLLGASLSNNVVLQKGHTINTNKFVIAGDIHKPQYLTHQILYLGSPRHLDWADVGVAKFLYIFNTWTQAIKIIDEIDYPRFIKTETTKIEHTEHDIIKYTGKELSPVFLSNKVVIEQDIPESSVVKSINTTDTTKMLSSFVEQENKTADYVDFALQFTKDLVPTFSAKQIKISAISIENFLSIKSCNYTYKEGIFLVSGLNKDAQYFQSNDSGKTAFVADALLWCLFGETSKRIKADEVINSFQGKNCKVELTVFVNDILYTICRTRKHVKSKQDIIIQKNKNNIDNHPVDNKDCQKEINKILGIDYKTFRSIFLFLGDDINFAELTDAKQKQLLDRFISLDFTFCYNRCKIAAQRLEQDIRAIENKQARIAGQIDSLKNSQQQLYTKQKEMKNQNEKIIQELKEQQTAVLTKLSQKKEIEYPKYETYKYIKQKQASLVESCSNYVAIIKQNETRLANIKKTTCRACGQVLPKRQREQKQKELKENINQTNAAWEQALQEFDKLDDEMLEIKDKVNHNVQQEIQELQTTLQTLKIQINNTKINNVDIIELINANKQEILTHQKNIKQYLSNVETKQNLLTLNLFWKRGFSNTGLKLMLLTQMLYELKNIANTYLQTLSNDYLSIDDLSIKNNKIHLQVTNKYGALSYEGLSKGTQARVNVAFTIALFQIKESYHNVDLVVFDELLFKMDEFGRERVMLILQQIKQNRKILVTSPNLIDLDCDGTIMIIKENGESKLERVDT